MWTAVFSIAFVVSIAMSVAALLMQSDRMRYPSRGRRPGAPRGARQADAPRVPNSMLI